MNSWSLMAVVLLGAASTEGGATVPGSDTTDIRVRYEPRELTTEAGARRLLRRIDDAALESCGASSFSLTELKIITAESRCWKDAVADAVRRIDSPLLTEAAHKAGR